MKAIYDMDVVALRQLRDAITSRIYELEEADNIALKLLKTGIDIRCVTEETWIGEYQECWYVNNKAIDEDTEIGRGLANLWKCAKIGLVTVKRERNGSDFTDIYRIA